MAKTRAMRKSEVDAHRRMHGATNKGTQPARLISNGAVVMSKPTEDANDDLSADIAEAVGKTIGNIVNRIEALDAEKAQLIKQLEDARASITAQFDKWLPATLDRVGDKAKEAARKLKREPCSICRFRTDPPHDARLKAHRDQGESKLPLTEEQLAASSLRRVN
jgi:hypothetical protein